MNGPFNLDSVRDVLISDKVRAIVAAHREIQKAVSRRTRASPRTWSSVGCVTEFVSGVFVVFYLLAAFTLGGAVLFFTFCH
jgi:hypothetical protein